MNSIRLKKISIIKKKYLFLQQITQISEKEKKIKSTFNELRL